MTYRIIYLNDNRWAICSRTITADSRDDAERFARLTHPIGPTGLYRIEAIDA